MDQLYPSGYLPFVVDFDLDADRWSYTVRARCGHGQAEERADLPEPLVRWLGSAAPLLSSSSRSEEPSAGEPERDLGSSPPRRAGVPGLGPELFQTIFRGEVRALYERQRQHASDRGLGLRVELNLQPDSLLNALPWELLQAPDNSRLGIDPYIPVVRCPAISRLALPKTDWKLKRLLIVAANPDGMAPLGLSQEIESIEDVCRHNHVNLVRAQSSEPWALREQIRTGDFDAVHFMGHAEFDSALAVGRLVLAGEDRRPMRLDADAVARLVVARLPRLVVLNACNSARTLPGGNAFSGLASALFQAGVPAVIGMQAPIPDCSAIAFSGTLYKLLADGWPIEVAVSESRLALSLADTAGSQWAVPALFLPSSPGEAPRGEAWELAAADSPRRRFDERFPNLHSALVHLRLFPEPRERRWLLQEARKPLAGWEQGKEPIHLVLRAESVPMTDLSIENAILETETQGRDPFRRVIQKSIRRLVGLAEDGEGPAALSAAVRRRSRHEEDIDRILRRSRRPLVLLGDPGSGKTHTLRRAALALAEAESKRVYPRIVVFVRLGEFHVPGRNPEVSDVYDLVRRACPGELRSPYSSPGHPAFEDLRKAGRLIVLFDGMDEMSRDGYTEHTLALSRFAFELAKYGGRCIFTCRVDEFSPALRHQRLVLLPLDRAQIKRYLMQRFPGHRSLPVQGERWRLGRLARYLTANPSDIDASNPFTLFLLCGFLDSRGAFPASQVEMLQQFFRSQYRTRVEEAETAGEPHLLREQDAFHAWSRIGWLIGERNLGTEIPVASLLADEALFTAGTEVPEVIRAGTLCGILDETWEEEQHEIRFRHHQFQEYFAARWIHEERVAIDWLAKLDAPRWQETMLNLVLLGGGEEGLAVLGEGLGRETVLQREALALHEAWKQRQTAKAQEAPPEGSEASSAGVASTGSEGAAEPTPPPELPPYSQEAGLADRVVLGARLVQHGGASSPASRLLRPSLLQAIEHLIVHGRPITQVKMLRACKALKEPSLEPAAQKAGRSPVRWVRDQALLLAPDLPAEIGFDLATSELLPRWMTFFQNAYANAKPAAWLALIVATVLGIAHLAVLLGLSLKLSWMCLHTLVDADREILDKDAVLTALGPSGALYLFLAQAAITLGVLVFALVSRPRRVWIWCLGAVPVGCALEYAGLAVWRGNFEGLGMAELILMLFMAVPVAAAACALLHLAVLAIYALAVPRRAGRLPLTELTGVAWRECAYGLAIAAFFVLVLFGLLGGGAQWLGEQIGSLLSVLGSWLFDGLSLVADWLWIHLGPRLLGVGALGLLAFLMLYPPVRRRLGRIVRALPELVAPVGCLAAIIAFLVFGEPLLDGTFSFLGWLWDHTPHRGLIPQGILLVILFVATRRGVRAFIRKIYVAFFPDPSPPGWMTPESWKAKLAAASPSEQQILLLQASHQSLGLSLRAFVGLFEEVGPLVKEEPALSIYWRRLDEIEEAVRQDRTGSTLSDPERSS